ncbi:Beta-barrel assembly machine subunit BamC [Acinetobacter calcoaceticus]|uniref:Beta-barrel assembly machine subunit BamC n=1 Tax=Acinetobacter calcoaceticus TaxID=471 RepID=A0A4R1XY17_ACICA|nr:Beta-barrel assembly machine subunit BamC [Acinetobacter calcoaceticus]
MQLRLGLTLALSALSLAGCNSIGISNGSLNYKNTTTLEPLKYPEGSMVRPATPLYPAPTVEALALQNAPNFANAAGNRYDLPRPEQEKMLNPATELAATDTAIGRPQLLTDGNGNPLIKIDGNSATIWKYTLATLSSLNYQVVGQSKNAFEVTLKANDQNYVIRLTSVGSSNNIAVFNADNSFADKAIASEILSLMYQNWPA